MWRQNLAPAYRTDRGSDSGGKRWIGGDRKIAVAALVGEGSSRTRCHRVPDRYCSKPSRKMASSLMIVPVALPAAVAWYCVFRNTDTEPAE